MSTIKYDDIKAQLEQSGWTLVSESYKNLNTELEYICNEGHRVYAPWRAMRGRLVCPICEANKFKDLAQTSSTLTKPAGAYRILALDQASKVTGFSVYDDHTVVHYGTYTTKGKDEISRLHEMREWLFSAIKNWKPDFIAIEGIQYQEQAGVTTFQTLARLQGILMDLCYEQGIPFEICPTNTWRNFCGVKGRTRADKKKSMQLLIKSWFDISVSDDIADAIGIGKYASNMFCKQVKVVNWE